MSSATAELKDSKRGVGPFNQCKVNSSATAYSLRWWDPSQ